MQEINKEWREQDEQPARDETKEEPQSCAATAARSGEERDCGTDKTTQPDSARSEQNKDVADESLSVCEKYWDAHNV